ncbi:ATP-binding protein [Nocardia sp. alder85J]|uniref:ATP-binding protein n=1 Tax=Nocardia sp. alder85J TaxID=2862949 RepID=UPI001CD1AB96|nr:ATP-binding protein [Nocardia sp. alder85J]MCX4090946.1 ATP-binding protein [Nocardia sp. alder85J]
MPDQDWLSEPRTRMSPVGVRVDAVPEQLTMLRALAETVTLMADFALDEVTDIRVALDEIATCLLSAAVPGSSIECEFGCDGDRMTVRVVGFSTVPKVIDQTGFGWHVLLTITDTLTVIETDTDGNGLGHPVMVEFSRRRGAADAG